MLVYRYAVLASSAARPRVESPPALERAPQRLPWHGL